ncbi:MAG: hypothetical protein ACXQS8_00210 [Candidatus Helarchaeales archaeon]
MPEAKEANLFVKAAVRKYVNEKEFKISKEVLDGGALNKAIKKVLDEAIEKAKAAKRKTLMAKDF